MSEKRLLIIGAGIAGLAAGCYARMNGYDAHIVEMNDRPGGLCTSWERKGFTLDGCLHYLFGTAPGQPFPDVWQELGALTAPVYNHDAFMHIVDRDGRTFSGYADPDRLADHMHALSPADGRLIDALADGIRQFTQFDMALLQRKPRALLSAEEWRDFGRRIAPFTLPLARWGRVTARDFAARFRDPLLRRALPILFGWSDIPVMAGMSVLAYMHTGNAGFPQGGSLAFARAIERRFLALGGTLTYKAHVERIVVENDRAVGVRLYDDSELRADVVISTIDGRTTLFHLLDGAYLNRRLRRLYDDHMPIHSQVQVSLGVTGDYSAEPLWTTFLLDEPVTIAGAPRDTLGVKHYAFDPTLAPAGHSVVVVALESDHDYWQRIYGRRLYDTEQHQVADQLLDLLERRYPGLRAAVTVKDVATPLSYERFTGNWLGATCGWLLTDKTMLMMVQGMDKSVPGLADFYMAGQWVEPGGSVPIVAMSGRNVIQLLCAADGKPFTTTVPQLTAD